MRKTGIEWIGRGCMSWLVAGSMFAGASASGFAQTKLEQAKPDQSKPLRLQATSKPAVGPHVQAQTLKARGEPVNKAVVGPPQPGADQPVQVKPGADVPKPTVVLKPGEVPAIKFDVSDYDFGRVRAGTDVTHDFWFTNGGNGPLEVLSVKPG